MKTLEPRFLRTSPQRQAAADRASAERELGKQKFELSDYLLLTGVVLVPFVSPIPGKFDPTPSGWTERVTLCDAFFILAMLLAGWSRLQQNWSDWMRGGAKFAPLVKRATNRVWALPPYSPIWFGTCALLAVMTLSWFANPLQPINSHMIVALVVQIYLATVGVMIASAVCRYGSPAPILAAWVIGFLMLAVICTYDSAALLTHRTMLYEGADARLRGPFRTGSQMAAYSLTSFFVVLGAAKFMAEKRWVRVAAAIACVAPMFIILASRRSAFVSLLAGFIALLVISKNRLQIFIGTVVPVVLLVVGLFLFAPQDFRQYALTRVKALTGDDTDRVNVAVDHFGRGLAAFKEHPVLGVGFGAFSDTRFGELTESIKHEQHSGYVAILAETGAVGFGLMLCLHLLVLYQLIRVWRSSQGRYRELALYLVVVLVALGVSEVYNRIWRERAMWIIVGLIAALPYVSMRDQLREKMVRMKSRFHWNGLAQGSSPPRGIV